MMFTGLIKTIGTVQKATPSGGSKEFTIKAAEIITEIEIGDSVAVNGICTTVTAVQPDGFRFTAAPETLKKTTAGNWKIGTEVNLELPLKVGDALHGHWVQGHVDTTVNIVKRHTAGSSVLLTVEIPKTLINQIVPRGSVALDGVSLTVARMEGNRITVSLIPHTLEKTTLRHHNIGDHLNLETDILGKHVIQYLQSQQESKVNLDSLREQGFH
jgi:riboflavin synthase